MDIGEFNGCLLYTACRLDYRLGLWAPTFTSHAVSAVSELLFKCMLNIILYRIHSTVM